MVCFYDIFFFYNMFTNNIFIQGDRKMNKTIPFHRPFPLEEKDKETIDTKGKWYRCIKCDCQYTKRMMKSV